ncbi:MAG: 3-deoxy-D-manno-octulosonic-acid transferase [Nitrospinales bacterium]|jgi:3-deoxy-D-manno-octulosonic-acid transferase
MTRFYHILSLLVSVVMVPVFTALAVFSKHKFKFLRHHFGFVPTINKGESKTLWLYALSLGEVKAAAPVLKKLHNENPHLKIAVSVTTDSGYEGAVEHLKMADNIFFHPLDCLPFTSLALSRIKPDLYVVTDTGFWPGLTDQLHKQNIPQILFNGRISHRSARGYLKAGSLFKTMFQKFDRLCMQNKNSAQATTVLGVKPDKIEVIGDPKFDSLQSLTNEDRSLLRKIFLLQEDTPVWIAGSTHAGEEEIILNAHQQLREKHADLILILAPRRIERINEVAALLQKKNHSFTRRSSLKSSESVVLLDTMGELEKVYSLGQVAFIGNSLIEPGGGHSLIEPLSHGVAVLHGPHIENIGHVADEAHTNGLAFTVHNSEEIIKMVHSLLEHKERRIELAEKAKKLIEDQQGASGKMAEIIQNVLRLTR